jgi:hypothetical protein
MTFPPNIKYEFVELIPAELEEAKVYISIPYSTAVHNCLCGCGTKVVTPIKPHKWTLIYDGESISLFPSIGNWNFPCRSHYWIREGSVLDAGPMPQEIIDYGRMRDAALTDLFYARRIGQSSSDKRKEGNA